MQHTTRPPDNRHSPKHQGGFTLIEVMIAITIFAIGLLAANMMQSASIRGNRSAAALSQGVNWAAGKMEEIKSWQYNDPRLQDDGVANPASGTMPNGPPTTPTPDGSDTSPDGVYTMIWYVTANAPVANSKTIQFKVYWNVRGRRVMTEFTSVISQVL